MHTSRHPVAGQPLPTAPVRFRYLPRVKAW